jgi:predicted 3-demethylubiquinone-9 3-methyltransferase (glyoxalase superfamily)
MQRIVPNLWFDHKAAEAAEFYTNAFPDARITETVHYPTEGLADFQKEFAGDVLYVAFEIRGYRFIAINAGPDVQVNPSISLMLNFDPASDPDARAHLSSLWEVLSEGGQVLMPLGEYDFSSWYGWVQDKYGITWQLMLSDSGGASPFIVPSLLFTELVQNRAGEAIDFYTSVFGGQVGTVMHYPEEAEGAAAGGVMFGDFELLGQWFAAMDSGVTHGFTFNFGFSLMVECADQGELDTYWSQLSSVPEAEQCGWCADKFGVSWQLVPANLDELMQKPGSYQKLMAMKKIEVAAFG